MYKIVCLDNQALEPDEFEEFEEAVQMIRWFIADDNESFTEPEHAYGVVDSRDRLLCVIKDNAYIDLKNFEFSIK